MIEISLPTTDDDLRPCLPVLHELRPALTEAELLAQIHLQASEGYRIAVLAEDSVPQTVAGFRVYHMLWSGKTLYVDDLVTAAAARSRGHGKRMLDWLVDYARQQGCVTFSLDSGTHRQDAHAFYLRERMRITSFHFARKL